MTRLIEWTLDHITGEVQRISLVTEPATEVDFMLFSSSELKFKVTSKDKRIVTGVVMRPNKKIVRYDENNKMYFGYFSKDTVRKASELFFREGQNTNNTNIEHEYYVKDVFVFESWIVEDPKMDKTLALGLPNIIEGDWVVSMKIENDEVWNDYLKTGLLKGFSVEIVADETTKKFSVDEVYDSITTILEEELDDDAKYAKIKQKFNNYI